MRRRLTANSRLIVHLLLLGAVLAACAVAAAHSLSLGRAVASAGAASFAAHAGLAIAIHGGVALVGAGVLFAFVRAHRPTPRSIGKAPGATLHAPRFYDWLAAACCFGCEGRMRKRTLDVAGVVSGERVLDVCCGTGTLALGAKRRVGASGSVHAVDASEEMIARARTKSARLGLRVAFEIAAAQSLPFPDATFDVVFCTLALHHLSEEGRAAAIAEMRRVVKPGGRVMIVEFSKGSGLFSVLHPIALLHTLRLHRARKSREILAGVVEGMTRSGFGKVVAGPLGFGVLGYALAQRD